ncbi:VanZ family protein [Streptomyces bathyalis]|uniref:VanZ family protein n=1 Tax=Streptomyces bathyalis TaxID=2710756 RepID=A0A7T1T402_9ACTN|nr:VanZ family protein [Streptomyces bathyalis]QPP05956.1 VanZ family protein [Streptomyces bathyalis]
MDHSTSPSAPARRTRRIVIVSLAITGAAIAAFGPVDAVLKILSMPLHRPVWHVWVGTFNGVALITVAALPLAALAVWALARRRSVSGTTPARAWRTSLAEVGMVYGTVPWVWMIMLPGDEAGAVMSLVPLRDLLTMDTGQVVGNLLVFAALGFLAPLRFGALASVPRVLALGAGCSVLVEAAQYVLRLDRVSSVDDVLLNAAGAGLAALASRRWWRATATASSDRPGHLAAGHPSTP